MKGHLKCSNTKCNLRSTCYRYLAFDNNETNIVFMRPNSETDCSYYIDIDENRNSRVTRKLICETLRIKMF